MFEWLTSSIFFYLSWLDWAGVIDILLVTLLIFVILHAIRGTRALVVLRGILLFFALAYIVSAVVDLPSLKWIISTSLPALLIALPILFQDELRRAFFSVGRFGIRRTSGKDFDRLKATLISAVERLSYLYIGAVIVIEGLTPLEDIISTGTRLNAESVTPELLQSIFNPKSPLRHGAVILRGTQLVAANCILPVETESAGPSHLASNQRSALGMSAKAPDALLVILSEERSDLSVVWNERVIEGVSLEEFSETLDDFKSKLSGRGLSPRKWNRGGGLLANVPSIMLAIILSMIIWASTVNSSNPIGRPTFSDIPLEMVGLESELIITNDVSQTVSVMIEARESQIAGLDIKDLRVWLDLSGLSPGAYRVDPQVYLADESVKVLSVVPSSVEVVIEQLMERELPPTIHVMGKENLSPGFAIGEFIVVPDSVLAVGPASLVNQVEEARIEIDLEGHQADFQKDYQPVYLDGSGQIVPGISAFPTKIGVTVPIERISTVREMAIMPSVDQDNISQGFEITSIRVSPVVVTILYDSNTVKYTGDYLVTAPVDLANVYSDLVVDVPIIFPEGVSAFDDQGNDVRSATVTVSVSPITK